MYVSYGKIDDEKIKATANQIKQVISEQKSKERKLESLDKKFGSLTSLMTDEEKEKVMEILFSDADTLFENEIIGEFPRRAG